MPLHIAQYLVLYALTSFDFDEVWQARATDGKKYTQQAVDLVNLSGQETGHKISTFFFTDIAGFKCP